MRDSERRLYLTEHNPWWRDPAWAAKDADLKAATRNALNGYDPHPLDGIGGDGLFFLMGPRRAGKSVAVKAAIRRLTDGGINPLAITFWPCETLVAQDLRRLVKLAKDITPGIEDDERFWFLDEITYVPDWAETLKQLRDTSILREGCVVATGSSTAELRAATGHLGGRSGEAGEARLLLPMGFRSFCRALYPDLSAILPSAAIALDDLQDSATQRTLAGLLPFVDEVSLAWERYLTIGGFPGAVADAARQPDVSVSTSNALWGIMTGDVLRVGSMSDRDVKAFIARLVLGLGSPMNVSNVAGDLNIGTRPTVADRIERLCASMYAWRASVTHDGDQAVKRGQDKLYFIDPLVARLPSLRDRAMAQPDITYLSEQQLGVTLIRAVAKNDVNAFLDEGALLVRRNPDSGSEIDFVGPHVPTPIESKYVSKNWKSERTALDEHYGRGIVATHDILDTTDHIWAVPAGILAWCVEDN